MIIKNNLTRTRLTRKCTECEKNNPKEERKRNIAINEKSKPHRHGQCLKLKPTATSLSAIKPPLLTSHSVHTPFCLLLSLYLYIHRGSSVLHSTFQTT